MRLSAFLEELGTQAIREALGVEAPAVVRLAQDPKHGDYQLNGVLPLAKKLGKKPRELADGVAALLAKHEALQTVDVAGPGFINLRLSPTWLSARTRELFADDTRDGVPQVERAERVLVDYSSPNVAKQMHVGHLRSTIIGRALVKLLSFVGHTVTGDNHIGDWGTQFGLLIVGMRTFGDEAALARDAIVELERVYKAASEKAKEDPAFADAARAELAKLQAGDADNRAMWERFVATTRTALEQIYARLGVRFDTWHGESAYDAMLPGVVQMLLDRGIAREDQGAICVFFENDPELAKVETPFIVRKKDGAFLYATTDVATALERVKHGFQRALYVVDVRQSLHFKQLFSVCRTLALPIRLEHVGFGAVLGPDGKPLKTREGKAVTLASLLDEAEARAAARIREEGLDVPETEIATVARAVGIGAVKYADLKQNRASDYQFDWDKMISFKGNSGPYLQYASARVSAIFRKGEVDPATLHATHVALTDPAELALARRLLAFGDVVHEAAEQALPHLVCDHLYELARAFSGFYEACPVLKSEGATREGRLVLCALTRRQLARGLDLLGIDTVERM